MIEQAKPVRFVAKANRNSYDYWEPQPLILVDDQGKPSSLDVTVNAAATRTAGAAVIVIGDSITAGNTDVTARVNGSSWPTFMSLASNGRMFVRRNVGVGGNTTAQMLARFDTDVLAYNPSAVLITGGTNDNDGVSDTYHNIEGMILKAKAAGVPVALLTPPPAGTPSNPPTLPVRNKLARAHRSIIALAEKYNLRLVDQRTLLINPATGTYKAGDTLDGTHPTFRVERQMGEHAWAVLKDMFPPQSVFLADDPFEAMTLVGQQAPSGNTPDGQDWSRALLPAGGTWTNGQHQGAPNTWDTYGGPAVETVGNDDPAIIGNYYRLQTTTDAGHYTGMGSIPTGWAVGDRLRFSAKIKVTGIDALAQDVGGVDVGLGTENGTSGRVGAISIGSDIAAWTTLTFEGTVTPGTTRLYTSFNVRGTNVTASIAQITVDNLTALGVATVDRID